MTSSGCPSRKSSTFLILAYFTRCIWTLPPISAYISALTIQTRRVNPRKEQREPAASTSHRPTTSETALGLIPLSNFQQEFDFFSKVEDKDRLCLDSRGLYTDDNEGVFELALVEEGDLPDLCRFVVEAFGADAIRLSQDMNAFERMLVTPAAELLNSYSGVVAFAEVFSGTKQRLNGRFEKLGISAPALDGMSRKEAIETVEKDSLVLALARPSKPSQKKRIEVIATIEIRLQPCDAKIPFSLPWLDKVERRLASGIGLGENGAGLDIQPYLSNLCVDERFRGKKIGKMLVRCVEKIVKTNWGYNRIYLHVDEENVPALSLYRGEGYRDVGHRWSPFWAGSAAEIGYYVKTL